MIQRSEKGEELFQSLMGRKKIPEVMPFWRGPLSQWHHSKFFVDGCNYRTAEHYMMAWKARVFYDLETLDKILNCATPKEAKAWGRKVRGFDKDHWDRVKYDIVVQGNVHKFSSNPVLKQMLFDVGDVVLVEASPVDCIWGIGLVEEDPDVMDPNKWKGENLLGFALMEVRHKLYQQAATRDV